MSADTAKPRGIGWPRYALLGGLGAAVLGLTGLHQFAASHALMLNVSPSLPYWALWLEQDNLPKRGEIIVFDPPRSALLEAHFGKVPHPFAKYALGLPGDRVSRVGRRFLVDGRQVALAKDVTRRGEPLSLGADRSTSAKMLFCWHAASRQF